MNLGEFRKATAGLPDNTPLLVGFQDVQKDRFVTDGVAVRPAGDLAEVKKKYGWEAFGALPGAPVILFAFDPETRKPPKPKAAAPRRCDVTDDFANPVREIEFHKSRRMWAVVDGTLLLAGREDARSHYEWLTSLLGPEKGREAFQTSTRGYVKDGVMAAYKPCAGDDFSRRVDRDSLILAYGVLGGCLSIKEFWIGVRNPGRPGGQWDPVCRVEEDEIHKVLAQKPA